MQLTDHFDTIADAGHRTAQGGALTTLVSWLVSSQGGVAVGILIGIVGLCVQVYYRRKQDRREQAEHDMRMGLYE